MNLFSRLLTPALALLLPLAASADTDAPLRSGDKIDVRIGGVPAEDVSQVSASYDIDGEGFINLTHLGKLRAAGLTIGQLASAIENAYKAAQIYTKPNIIVSQPNSARFVNIGGDVRSPTRVPYTPDLTLNKAIVAAGDFNEYADQRKVRLSRDGKMEIFDFKAIRKDPSKDVKLMPGDDIFVPQSWW